MAAGPVDPTAILATHHSAYERLEGDHQTIVCALFGDLVLMSQHLAAEMREQDALGAELGAMLC